MKSSNFVDSSPDETRKLSNNNNDRPVCPKPRRLGSVVPDFLKPPRCTRHSHSNTDERSGVLDIIAERGMDGGESGCSGCTSPACYTGSPPGRTDNPLVHDAHFVHHQTVELLSPLTRTNLSDKFGLAASSSPSVSPA